jgi:hypothetical protein
VPHTIITDAFAAAFEQVYGEKGLTGTIKPDSEQVFKEPSPNTLTSASSDLSGFWSLGILLLETCRLTIDPESTGVITISNFSQDTNCLRALDVRRRSLTHTARQHEQGTRHSPIK